MKKLIKNKTFLLSIILFVVFLTTSFLTIFFANKSQYVVAASNFDNKGFYNVDGVSFYAIKVKNVEFSRDYYYPTYELSLKDGKLQYVKVGETVLLEEGEAIMLSFARQEGSKIANEPQKGLENALIYKENNAFYDSVDFLNASLKFNGNAATDATTGEDISSSQTKKFFGYIVATNNVKTQKNEEGLVEFNASFEHDDIMKEFSFSCYVFNKSTYQRTESLNNTDRPNTTVDVVSGGGNYVIDKAYSNSIYSEYFYYYKNQKLAQIKYNPKRYELTINKTIHGATTEYNFSYNATTENIVYTCTPNAATSEMYARNIYWQLADSDGKPIDVYSNTTDKDYADNKPYIDADGNITLIVKDIGVFDISYKAVYFNKDSKAYLDSLNQAFAKKDRLTIFGVQATYNDLYAKQTELRNKINTISADITGKIGASDIVINTTNATITVAAFNNLKEIASTNQPQVSFLYNTTFSTANTLEVFYTYTLTENVDKYSFARESSFDQTTPLTKAGYYLVRATYTYDLYKEWLGSSSNTNTTQIFTQYFLFRIKDQTPTIGVTDEKKNNIMSGYFAIPDDYNSYVGSYVSSTVSVDKLEKNSEFDLATTMTLEKREFGKNSWAKVALAGDGEKYQISDNGHYRLTINFGNSSSTKRYFDIDKEEISGIKAQNVSAMVGNRYYNAKTGDTFVKGDKLEVFSTSSAFTLTWDNKRSGAKTSAKYVRYAMENFVYSDVANNYIIQGSKIAANSQIRVALTNPETVFEKANSLDVVTANEVLSLAGLYIFEITDEAGNSAYFAIIVDNSTPIILQATERDNSELNEYKIITAFNNISQDTRIFWGKEKLVSVTIGSELNKENPLHRYILQIFNEDKTTESDRFEKIGENIFAKFKITSATKKEINDSNYLTITNSSEGYDIIKIVVDDKGNYENVTYSYTVIDESRNYKVHNVAVNSEKTGMGIYYETGNEIVSLDFLATKTGTDNGKTIKNYYFYATNAKEIYLKWENLEPDFDAKVDLAKNGLIVKYYELKYDNDKKTFKYEDDPTQTIVISSGESGEYEGTSFFKYLLNSVSGETLAGKYEFIRTYSKTNSEDSRTLSEIVKPDSVVVNYTFYVDRKELVNAPSGNNEQVGYYDFITFFDGYDDGTQTIITNELFKQSQSAGASAVVTTNKLPVGIYIPISKYGTAETITIKDLYNDNSKRKFTDNMQLVGLDKNATYQPFKLNVTLTSPRASDGTYVIYNYATDNGSGFYTLTSYTKVSSVNGKETRTTVEYSDKTQNAITKNELTGSKEWSVGEYVLTIQALKDYTKNDEYQQTYVYKFNVTGDKPKFDVTGSYKDLPNMEDTKLEEVEDNKYYTNADKLLISWEDFENEYRVKIDKNRISYRFDISSQVTLENVTTNSFEIDVISGAMYVDINMVFEVYGKDSTYQAYFPNGSYKVSKRIYFDREAPSSTVDDLKQSDTLVSAVDPSIVRIIGDRYNISNKTSVYRFYSFVTTNDAFKALLFRTNDYKDTKEIFYRDYSAKYQSGDSHETGNPYDLDASPNNVFNIQLASAGGEWTKVSKENKDALELANGYYEIAEVDYAGNISIYTIYICEENPQIEIKYNYRVEGEQTSGSATLEGLLEVSSREKAAITSIKYNSVYGFIKFTLQNKTYLISPFNSASCVFDVSSGNEIKFSSFELVSTNSYRVVITDSVASKVSGATTTHTVVFNVAEIGAALSASVVKDSSLASGGASMGLFVTNQDALKLQNLDIYALEKDDANKSKKHYALDGELLTIAKQETSEGILYYIVPDNDENWTNYIFLFVYTDNFGRTNYKLSPYSQSTFSRYEGSSDITSNMLNQANIVVSAKDHIYFNEKIDNEVSIEVKSGDSTVFTSYESLASTNNGYISYQLKAQDVNVNNNGYNGGVVVYKITVKEDLSAFKTVFSDISLNIDNLSVTTYYVTIVNETPNVVLRNAKGEDITQNLYNKSITHSDDIFMSFNSSSERLSNLGISTKVLLRKRGASEGYVQITSPYTISGAGTYDLRIVNYTENNEFSYTYDREFTIASYNVNFYSVVKFDASDVEDPYKLISPTGKAYKFDDEYSLINYHYILNSTTYEISVNNGVKATLIKTKVEGLFTTNLYKIESASADTGTSIKFSRLIAVTVVTNNSNILSDSFLYYYGTDEASVGTKKITKDAEDIYVYKTDSYNVVTLQWNSYFALKENKIFYQISRDGGLTWSEKIESSDNDVTTLELSKSGNYIIMFSDVAGNVQTISTSTGLKDRYKINFVKSVIFLVNGENPIDNAVYNEQVVVSIPSSTLSYYQSSPILFATLNGEEISISKDNGNYVFTKPGNYVIYFTATKAGNELDAPKISFSIVNTNDSRWAFSYLNYNDYKIDYIKYNNIEIDINSVLFNGEIIMSVINGEMLDNGLYTIKMTTNEIPAQSFEFTVWLNNQKPDIIVSQEEGKTTTGEITVRFNAENIYDMIGDCIIYINGTEVANLNKEYFENENYEANVTMTLKEVGVYYIQVYTSSDKLIYSHKAEIVAPLNTISIILIVVGSVVLVVGIVLFVLLRKKLKIR